MNWFRNLFRQWFGRRSFTSDSPGGALVNSYGEDLQDANALIHRANKRATGGDIEGALSDFNVAIQLNPTRATAYYNRGFLQNTLGQFESAIADFSQALALLPDYDEAYYQRGNSYLQTKDLWRATQDFSRAIQLNPYSIKSYYKRAEAYGSLGDVGGALADYAQVLTRIPKDANAYYQRGRFLAQIRELKSAIDDFSTALTYNPRHADAYCGRGCCYAELGDIYKATQDLTQAIFYNPSHQAAYYQRMYSLGVRLSNPDSLLQNLAPVETPLNGVQWHGLQPSELTPDNALLQEPISQASISQASISQASISQEETPFQFAPQEPPSPIDWSQEPTAATFAIEVPTELLEPSQDFSAPSIDPLAPLPDPLSAFTSTNLASSTTSKLEPESLTGYFERAHQRAMTGDVSGAIADYTEIIEHDPHNTRAYFRRGQNFNALGQTDAALEDLNQAIHWARVNSLGLLKDFSGVLSDTIQTLKTELNKPKPSAVDTPSTQTPIKTTISIYTQLINREPNNPEAYFKRGQSRALLGDLKGAIADYTETIALDPHHAEAYYRRGLNRSAIGDATGSVQDLNQAIRYKQIQPKESAVASPIPPVPLPAVLPMPQANVSSPPTPARLNPSNYCNHDGNRPGNRFCIFCGEPLMPMAKRFSQ